MSATPALEPAPTAADDTKTAVNEAAEETQASGLPDNEPEEAAPAAVEGQAEIEPKETAVTKETESGQDSQSTLIDHAPRGTRLSQREREAAVAKVRESMTLPPVLKERFAALVESSGDAAGDGKVRVSIEDAIRTVEEALPDFLRSDRSRASQPGHPAGDAFFSGDPSELSDAQAEELARTQLARSGLLRGQRVRVAE